MKYFCTAILLILNLGISEGKAFEEYDNQIKEICKRNKYKSVCLRDMENKKLDLLGGKSIKIPVFPYKGK